MAIDVHRYVDLKEFDEDPIEVFNDILATARSLIPGWRPQAGQIETALAEVFAVRSSEVARSANRVVGAAVQTILQLFELDRIGDRSASAQVTITFTDSNTVTRRLSQGTQFVYVDSITGRSHAFALDEDFTLSGSLSGTATVTAVVPGTQANLQSQGGNLTALISLPYVQSVVFNEDTSGGSSAETDDRYFERAVNHLGGFSSSVVTKRQIVSYVSSSKDYAYRVNAYPRRRYRDRDTTASDHSEHSGHVLVAVGGRVTSTNVGEAANEIVISPVQLQDLYNSLRDRSVTTLSIDVMSMELAAVAAKVIVKRDPDAVNTSVRTAVDTEIRKVVSPSAWNLDHQLISLNDFRRSILGADGVNSIVSVTLHGSPVVGEKNVGVVRDSGGSKAEGNLARSSSTAINEGEIFYYVDRSDSENPVILQYEAESDHSAGTSAFKVVSVENGVKYNTSNNGGQVPTTASLIRASNGTSHDLSSNSLSKGSDDTEQFDELTQDGYASTTINVRNSSGSSKSIDPGTMFTYVKDGTSYAFESTSETTTITNGNNADIKVSSITPGAAFNVETGGSWNNLETNVTVAFKSGFTITGGTDAEFVEMDLVMRNLGTLPILKSLEITVRDP